MMMSQASQVNDPADVSIDLDTIQAMDETERQAFLSGLPWQPVSIDDFKALSKEEQLFRIRHSAAHIMADAVQHVRPGTSFATGPATEHGFFYDMVSPEPLTNDDLETIQSHIDQITAAKHAFEFATIPKADARRLFKGLGQRHKQDILTKIPTDDVTLYRHGNFLDLCAGPHVPLTSICANMKVLNLSASHWRGEAVPSLTRLTGTAWAKDKDLNRYLEFLEESKKRDHRVLGPQLDLFSFHPWASGALWHPHGVTLRHTLMDFWRKTIYNKDYQEILNPQLYRKDLFETSGHWDHYQENMFIFRDEQNEPDFVLKPMNCPDTMLYYKTKLRSYKELPLRIAEGQILHRNEASGAIHGIMRTRNFVQDDAHVFLTTEHVHAEVQQLMGMIDELYGLFDLTYTVSLSTRPDDYMGEKHVWDEAERALEEALQSTGKAFEIDEGEGAFYGPKVDIHIQDSLGRRWQCGTIQLDFQLPERFDLTYIAQDGSHQRPIVVHRAIFGSFDRFVGILIEHLGGAFPTWLAPIQVTVLPIADRHADYARQVAQQLTDQGIRVDVDTASETVNNRI
ncbi:MAG: threonine--tRNA ligase, partial [Cyanobacteria bacterium HKST-UBA06]|nr:threonine--tRNA ligase [Cyanobacteria bacterium HKST-UBA06]